MIGVYPMSVIRIQRVLKVITHHYKVWYIFPCKYYYLYLTKCEKNSFKQIKQSTCYEFTIYCLYIHKVSLHIDLY